MKAVAALSFLLAAAVASPIATTVTIDEPFFTHTVTLSDPETVTVEVAPYFTETVTVSFPLPTVPTGIPSLPSISIPAWPVPSFNASVSAGFSGSINEDKKKPKPSVH